MNSFTDLKQLGAGGQGRVYFGNLKKSRHSNHIYEFSNFRKICIKIFHTIDRQSEKEIDVLSRLSHPNIVQFLGLFENRKLSEKGYVMEYMAGGSLHSGFCVFSEQKNSYKIVSFLLE